MELLLEAECAAIDICRNSKHDTAQAPEGSDDSDLGSFGKRAGRAVGVHDVRCLGGSEPWRNRCHEVCGVGKAHVLRAAQFENAVQNDEGTEIEEADGKSIEARFSCSACGICRGVQGLSIDLHSSDGAVPDLENSLSSSTPSHVAIELDVDGC